MRTKVLQVKWIVSIVVRNVDCYWLSLMSVSFFLSHENFRNWTTCFCFNLCNLQTAVLAAATLLFLIALPLVNCKRRNTLRIEELDDNLSVKGYDHGKRENTMKQPIMFSLSDVCNILSEEVSKCKNKNWYSYWVISRVSKVRTKWFGMKQVEFGETSTVIFK